MSTHYGYHCATCDVSSPHWINHGDNALRALYVHRAVFIEAERLIEATPINRLMQGLHYWSLIYDEPAPIEYLRAHEGHVIGLEDEYGRRIPLEENDAL